MEPAAFLVSQAWTVVAYIYFMATRSEFTNEDLQRRIRRAGRAAAKAAAAAAAKR